MRPCDPFLQKPGALLADHGYAADPGLPEQVEGCVLFYHYTRPEYLHVILADGLYARRPVVWDRPPEIVGGYLLEGFLEPQPKWLSASPYFGDLGLQMVKRYIGSTLLKVTVPLDYPGLYVADYAHVLECKHVAIRGVSALNLGYDCRDGREVTLADVNSYVPLATYKGGHVAPVVTVVRTGQGIAIPAEYISVAETAPDCL
ncbi:MAG: hypothetical protein ACM3XM_08780 [Mycobacterium leprae]